MVTSRYRRPGNKVPEVYRGKALEERIRRALESMYSSDKKTVGTKDVRRFLRGFSEPGIGVELVLIVEKSPLNSVWARGRCGDKIYSYIGKTGTQYVKEYKKPRNPRTIAQQEQRMKYKEAVGMWRVLPESEKEVYRQKAVNLPMTGYNLFIRSYLKTT